MNRKLPSLAAVLGLAALCNGCTSIYQGGGPPTVMVDTPFGPPRVIAGGPANAPSGNNLAAPPPGLEPPATTVPSGSRNGVYSGVAVPLDTGGGLCIQNRNVGDFRVRGNSVHWGVFRGRIAPDNGLQMDYGQDWVFGQFVGDTFHGQLSLNARFGQPGCTYMMSLQKTNS